MTAIRAVNAHLRRRLLISYRVDPEVAVGLVPAPFRPQIVDGSAVAGVCVLGLQAIRPAWWPIRWGVSSENAAHRIAVEWDEEGEVRRGVFIFQRHSTSLMPVLLGGRLFPGVHKRARFTKDESGDRLAMTMDAKGETLAADVTVGGPWQSSLFPTLESASDFYRGGRIGWSRKHDGIRVEPMELTSRAWHVEPGQLTSLSSSFFDALPPGSATFDSVVVMRNQPLTLSA